MRFIHSLALVALMGSLFTGCTRIRDTKGYIADDQQIATLQPGVENKNSVTKLLGKPSIISEYDPNTWYYVSESTAQLAFMQPKPVKHQVLVVKFNDKGNLLKVEKKGLDQIVEAKPATGKTPTRGKELTFWQQLFGDLGRFGGGSSGKSGGGGGGDGGDGG